MRIAIYNQMFGLNGRFFWSNLIGHWAVHFQSKEDKIWKRTNIEKTISVIRKSKTDIVGIIEVLEGQEKELKERIRELGYEYIHFALGHKTKFNKLYIKSAVASKIKFEIKNKNSAMEEEMGSGGGFIHCWLPELKIDLITIHLSLKTKRKHQEHLGLLENYLKRLGKKIILLGDFNLSYEKIRKYFRDFELASDRIKSYSMTPVIKWFVYKDFDHILVRGLKKDGLGTIEGYSDHKLVWVDFIERG